MWLVKEGRRFLWGWRWPGLGLTGGVARAEVVAFFSATGRHEGRGVRGGSPLDDPNRQGEHLDPAQRSSLRQRCPSSVNWKCWIRVSVWRDYPWPFSEDDLPRPYHPLFLNISPPLSVAGSPNRCIRPLVLRRMRVTSVLFAHANTNPCRSS